MKGVSVVIPVFNRERHLGEAIESVLAQRYPAELEIIVSDDGSSDGSRDVARSYGGRVVLLEKPVGCRSQGAAGARNRGIARATQPYLAFLDSDDFYLPGHLTRMAGILERRPEIGFVISRVAQMRERDGRRLFAPWTRLRVTERDATHPVVAGSDIAHTNGFLFRTNVFPVVGVFDEAYSNHEDGDLWMRISERYRGAFSDHYGAVYRVAHDEGQLTSSVHRERSTRCLIQVVESAVKRCEAAAPRDGYRLFRLRLMAASLATERRRALASIALRHPVSVVATLLSPRRLAGRMMRTRWVEDPSALPPASKDST